MGAGEGTKTAGQEGVRAERSKGKREREIRLQTGKDPVDKEAMSTFPCAGAKNTFLETANRSNCVFLASTFTEPYTEQCKTEHKHINAFSFKDMSSTQVSTFISQSYFILDFT